MLIVRGWVLQPKRRPAQPLVYAKIAGQRSLLALISVVWGSLRIKGYGWLVWVLQPNQRPAQPLVYAKIAVLSSVGCIRRISQSLQICLCRLIRKLKLSIEP